MTTDLMERPQSNATDIAVPVSESSAIVPVVAERDPYVGIASMRVSKEAEVILLRACEVNELDILPTGEVYMSQVEYRRRLNAAFGPGGWALRPFSKPTVMGNTLMQEWGLYAEGRFISSAWGEHDYNKNNPRDSYATAAEALKSNGLTRCCKDLGIAAECWDRRFAEKFKKDQCVKVWREKAGKQKTGEYQWRRKDAEPFYDESQGKRQRPEPVPDDVDATTGEVQEPESPTLAPVLTVVGVEEKRKSDDTPYWRVQLSDGRSAFTEDSAMAELARRAAEQNSAVEVSTERKGRGLVLTELIRAVADPTAKPF